MTGILWWISLGDFLTPPSSGPAVPSPLRLSAPDEFSETGSAELSDVSVSETRRFPQETQKAVPGLISAPQLPQ